MTSSEENNSVSETQNLDLFEKSILVGATLLIIYGLIIAPNIGTRLVLLGIQTIILSIFFSKKVLILTLENGTLVLEKRSKWNYFKKTKTIIELKDLGRITICNIIGSRGGNFIELTHRNNKHHLLRYTDIKNRASAIKLIRPFLEDKSIRLIVYITIYDPAFETIKEIIEKKYNKTPNKFNPDIRFEGDTYL